MPELYSLAVGDAVVCGPKKAPGILRHFEDHDCDRARVEMANGKLKRWASSDLRPARAPRVPPVRAVHPEIEESDEAASFELARGRSVGTVRAPIVEQPKAITPRSPKFLEHLRGQPCCHCGAAPRSEAAHFGARGIGIKSSDFEACALCPGPNGCHAYWHLHGTLPGLDREQSMAVQWRGALVALVSFLGVEEAARALAAWIVEGRRKR